MIGLLLSPKIRIIKSVNSLLNHIEGSFATPYLSIPQSMKDPRKYKKNLKKCSCRSY